MKKPDWDTIILSDPEHEHLVAELHFGNKFLLLLDREDGRENVHISFPETDGNLGSRIPLSEFIEKLQLAAENLRR